jgi:hypothetical protein
MPVCLKYCILGGEAVALGRRREQEEEENMAVAEPEFTCTHMTYTFTYMIVFTCLYFVLHVCTRYLYRIRYQYTRRNTIIPCTGGGENERAFWYLYLVLWFGANFELFARFSVATTHAMFEPTK